MVYLFLLKGRVGPNGRMFFLGAAFMLLETRSVVQMALLFGSTWLVNSAVFFTVLILILVANLYGSKCKGCVSSGTTSVCCFSCRPAYSSLSMCF